VRLADPFDRHSGSLADPFDRHSGSLARVDRDRVGR
jgi:hypothetical protein